MARASRAGEFAASGRRGRCRCARQAHKRGRFAPSCESPPPGMFADARDRKQICPHSVEKFVCDNVAADKFRACPRGGGLAMYGLCLLFA